MGHVLACLSACRFIIVDCRGCRTNRAMSPSPRLPSRLRFSVSSRSCPPRHGTARRPLASGSPLAVVFVAAHFEPNPVTALLQAWSFSIPRACVACPGCIRFPCSEQIDATRFREAPSCLLFAFAPPGCDAFSLSLAPSRRRLLTGPSICNLAP